MTQYEFTATCLFGLEGFVGEEIDALGYRRIETIDGRVSFLAPMDAICRFNINSRYAERLYIKLGSFKAETFDMLFEGTKALPWSSWIGRDDAFPVKGHSIRSKLTSIPDCQKIVKKAVVEAMKSEYELSVFPEDGVKYQIEFFILNDLATLMIDTSGAPLHKRGYRTDATEAPIRETLAAAMCKISRPREDVLFWDPMCGSGTIPIEAALMMTNTAPGQNRSFAAQDFYDIPEAMWSRAFEEARDNVNKDSAFAAFASDNDEKAIAVTEQNIKRAGIATHIRTFCADALTIATEGRRGTIVTNPPYGERLLSVPEAQELYKKMGAHFSTLDNWQIYIISSSENFERFYGRRADKARKLYNGMIKCYYYQFFKKKERQ